MTITDDVSDLVRSVLGTFSRPYGEKVTLKVFIAIEANPTWLRRYHQIADEYYRGAINPVIGKQVKDQTRMKVSGIGKAKGTSLIKSYTKLKN